jgi:arylformamidase
VIAPDAATREALDAGYNLRARHPDHEAFFQAYAAASRQARDRAPWREFAYGPHPRQRITLFPAAPGAGGGGAPPLLAFLHGGYWQAMSRQDFEFPGPAFADRGIAYAAVGYALCPQVSMPTLVEQVRKAVAWLYDHAAGLGIDGERIFLAGHSAGGHLAAALASTDWPAHGHPAGLVKGATAISGLFDLEPIRRCYLNEVLALDADTARALSPIHSLPRPPAPALLLSVGGRETAAFHDQQARYHDAWAGAGHAVRTVAMPAHHHFDIVQAFADPTSPLFQAVADLALTHGH